MGDQRLGTTDLRPGRVSRNRRIGRRARTAIAGVLTLGLAMSGSLAAIAATGGGSVGGGSGGPGVASEYWLFSGDNYDGVNPPQQGWGQTSIDTFATYMETQGGWATGVGSDRTGINTACSAALDQAISRSGGASSRARVVQVGVAVDYSSGSPYMGWTGDQAAMRSWYQGLTDTNYWQPDMAGFDATMYAAVHDTFISNVIPQPRIVCVALNSTEPVRDYDLAITTDKSATFTLAGSTAAVSDSINASTASPIRENVTAVVTLKWGGVEGNGTQRSKNVSIANSGTTRSPNFTPGDFGWTSWPSGKFWFDVSVAKQGQMAAATSHNGFNDSRENWTAGTTPPRKVLTSGAPADVLANDEVLTSGMFYNAEITARTNGYDSSMTINDTVATDQVWIGSATADDSSKAYVEDPNGNKVAGATISITRAAGSVKVSGTVTNIPDIFQAREYTLVVPTYVLPTTTDYTITDDSSVCYTAAQSNCIAGNSEQTRKVTPAPDKVWVLDENGALSTADPAQTNQAGVDNKVFSPGAGIGAVVNGTVPAKLAEALSSYSLTDDWTGAAQYIDFSDASKAKVFLNGADVTSQFTITVSGTKTIATAKATFLGNTKGLAQERSVKLFISGAFKSDYDTNGQLVQLTNTGSEMWNNQTVSTNTPAIYTVTPNPDKVWVLDENGAMSAFDANGTNATGVDTKTFAPGAGISAVVNGSIPANLGAKFNSYSLTDDWTGAAQYVDFSDPSTAKVFLDGTNVTSQFDITVVGTQTIATAKAAFLNTTAGRATAGVTKLFVTGAFRNTYDTNGALARLTNSGAESWNGKSILTNSPAIFTVTPTPDKVWVLDENGGLATSDTSWNNTSGLDGKVFLQNDAVAAVVNGSIPSNLGAPLYNYSITDDWTDAATYVDFSEVTLAKVFYNGTDVTSEFNVNVVGTKTIATAKAPFLAATVGLATAAKIKLIISGVFRADYDTDGQIVTLTNAGTETWNNRTEATNTPPVYVWTPNPNKQVLGSTEESGDLGHENINGASVWPGQKLEYSVGVDLRVPANTARGIQSLAVEDIYDPYFVPNKTSIEFWDSRSLLNPKPVARSAYKIVFDEAGNKFTATFTQAWIDANVGVDGSNSANDQWLTQGWLTMRLTGTVSKSIAAGSTVVNQAFQIVNGARTATEIPVVQIPTVTPNKESLNTDLIDIDGKTVVEGDAIFYRLTMDGGPARDKLAYNVHKFGMVDDFDEAYLKLEQSDIAVTEKATGLDVTSKFNVQVKDGVAYVFAKTVDTANVYGGTIPGDPQATDLALFDQATIRPLEDPIIDQALLGQNYWITLKTTVTKEEDGYVIKNQARQNIQNVLYSTKIVSNPLNDIDPSKDVVVSEETKDNSINQSEIKMNSVFNYRLNSSEIPADRAYKASQWSISDTFDRVHDQYTGIWAAYANIDIYQGNTLVFAKGDLLQDSAGHESEPWKDLFAVTFDEGPYTLTATATQKYLDLVQTRPDMANAFSVYTKMVRVAPGEKIENKVMESYNKFQRESNTVWTFTNENPSIEVVKFTLSEGEKDGDRSDVRLAYELTTDQLLTPELPADAAVGDTALQNGVEVGIRFTNTGDVPLTNIKLVDITHDGLHGDVQNIMCAVPADPTAPALIQGGAAVDPAADGMQWVLPTAVTTLDYSKTVDCKGTLRDMAPGMTHGDTVVVTGESVFTQTLVKAENAWFATAASTPGLEVVKYTLDEGIETGDRNTVKDALALTPKQGKNGVRVGFDVTNTGDEPLKNLAFTDATNDATTGKVTDVKWLDLVVPDPVADPAAVDAAAAADTITIGDKTYTPRPLADLTELAVGQRVLLVGTLTGVKAGTGHTDVASVTAEAAYSGIKVSDSDPWNAKLAAIPPAVIPPLVPKGALAGDPLAQNDAKPWLLSGAAMLLLAAGVAAYGIRRRQLVAVTNTGRGGFNPEE